VVDLLAGHVDMDFENLPAVIQHIRSGRVRALAVASAQRSELLPEVPTLKELGWTDLVAAPWFALVVPAGTPREIVARLNAEVNKILSLPDTKELLAKQGADPILRTPEETTAFIHQEVAKWAKIVRESGAKVE
jgi:tripartite-type tricarboxylate transporter receptor subunit TctC